MQVLCWWYISIKQIRHISCQSCIYQDGLIHYCRASFRSESCQTIQCEFCKKFGGRTGLLKFGRHKKLACQRVAIKVNIHAYWTAIYKLKDPDCKSNGILLAPKTKLNFFNEHSEILDVVHRWSVVASVYELTEYPSVDLRKFNPLKLRV